MNNLITIYESISICKYFDRYLQLTHKGLTSSQPRIQACQLFQASAVLVPVLTFSSFDPLSRTRKFSFPFFLLKATSNKLDFKKHRFFSVYRLIAYMVTLSLGKSPMVTAYLTQVELQI